MEIKIKVVLNVAKVFIAFVLWALSDIASAEIIDDIRVKTGANGEVDAAIKFTLPVLHLRYFPPQKSQYLVIYFNILDSVSQDQWRNYESHRFPPSDVVTKFTATTRDLNTGPKIEIEFNRPVEFSVKAGRDGRSLYIHIKPGQPQQDKQKIPVPVQSGGITTPSVVAPVIAATPKAALPGVAAATAQSAPPTTASGVSVQPLPAPQLGGKDGLPVFRPSNSLLR